jgi:hypothetical protein
MPAEYRIDRPGRVAHVRAWGVLTDDDMERTRHAVLRDVVFGVARMYAILSDREYAVEVFRDRGRAMRWLMVAAVV